jgi:nicotinate-nucleotide adenylyltransferase
LSASRVGILGGTFDPIHYAHLAIAEQAREQLALEQVLFVPAWQTVHKPADAVSPAEHRAAMVQLAIADNPAFALSRIEMDRGGPSYTVDTLAQLTASSPRAELFFIMSAEAVRDLPGWREPARILELATVAVVPRLGYATPDPAWLAQAFPGSADRFVLADAPALGHSASDIRRRVRAGLSIRYLVPPPVDEYIRRHALYQGAE